MVDVNVTSKEIVTPGSGDTVLGVQSGQVKRFLVSALPGQGGGGTVAPSAQPRGPLRLVSLGDSNTQGSGNTPWSGSHEAIVSRAGGKIIGVKNAGISGQDCAAISNRIVTDVVAYKPDVVVMQVGTNNSYQASVILPYIESMVKVLLGATDAVVVVCSTYPSTTSNQATLAAAIEDLVVAFDNSRVLYAPTHEALADATTGYLKAEYADDDTVHTGDAGGLVVADTVLATIAHLLTDVSPLEVPKLAATGAYNPITNNRFESGALTGFSTVGAVTGTYVESDPAVEGGFARFEFAVGTGAEVKLAPVSGFAIKEWAGKRAFIAGRVRVSSSSSGYTMKFQLSPFVASMLGGYNQQGSFVGLDIATRWAGRDEWNFFYMEFDIKKDAVLSATSVQLLYSANVNNGSVIVDLTDMYCGIVGPAHAGYKVQDSNVKLDANKTLTTESLVRFNCANGARTLTLPSVANAAGPITVIRTDSTTNVLTVAPASGQTIQGASSVTIDGQWTKKVFYPDPSSNWIMLD